MQGFPLVHLVIRKINVEIKLFYLAKVRQICILQRSVIQLVIYNTVFVMFFYYKYLLHIYGRNIDVIIKRFYRYVSAFYFNKSVQHM